MADFLTDFDNLDEAINIDSSLARFRSETSQRERLVGLVTKRILSFLIVLIL